MTKETTNHGNCSVCGLVIDGAEAFVGTGHGDGNSFAHKSCRTFSFDEILRDGESTKPTPEETLNRALRYNLRLAYARGFRDGMASVVTTPSPDTRGALPTA